MPDDVYTHGHHEAVLRSHNQRTVENSAAYLIPHLRPGIEVLDIGCGPGSITIGLAQRVRPGRVVGIDRSPEIVEAASARPEVPDTVTFSTGDAYALDFADNAFDVVHAHQVLQHLSDPVAALGEMRRVCRPGGLVAVRDADYGGFRWAPDDARLDRWLELYRAVARSNGAEPDAGKYLKRWALDAGCSDVEASASVWCWATPSEQEWWGSLWAERMTDSLAGQQAIERGLATRADLVDIAAGFHAWTAAPDAWFIVPHGEVLARP
jgi:ubiquinone/menaquinone biosynthesis C-methylase UbiE